MATPALEFVKGDTNRINLVIRRPVIDASTGKQSKDVSGNLSWTPLDLGGATIVLTARTRTGAVAFTIGTAGGTIVVQAPSSDGHAIATVAPALTSSMTTPTWLNADVQVTEADGTVTTVWRGQIAVVREIT